MLVPLALASCQQRRPALPAAGGQPALTPARVPHSADELRPARPAVSPEAPPRSLAAERVPIVGRVHVYAEALADRAGSATTEAERIELTLPQSRVQVAVLPAPVVTEADVLDVEIAPVELGRGLSFRLAPEAVQRLNRALESAPRRRLVLSINDVTLGSRRMDQVLTGDRLSMLVELPDVYLPRLLLSIKPSAADRTRPTIAIDPN